jgi:hypothetical protein
MIPPTSQDPPSGIRAGDGTAGQPTPASYGGATVAENEAATAEATIRHLPPKAASLVAIGILLADPEALGDDTLESGLYILREKLRAS